ncbi:kinesin light chain 3-like isoform X1 [Melia azedarach]|uniref:Kinesin light chain 3-like isoform X1 n=1 Tax=Melia azedarach TaxID=155640 RepID=A0ACC1X6H4_MELAZ|nr:kinesin light chain 3-like isoform X1 [Melia azedarach]
MYLRQATANLGRRIRDISSRIVSSSGRTTINSSPLLPSSSGKAKFYCHFGSGGYSWGTNQNDSRLWILLGQAALIFGINPNLVLAEDASIQSGSENATEGANVIGLRKIEDGSVVSNEHTSKWRIFTDNGRDYFMQGKLEEAEKFFLSALQEAKEGFGERDPHVASACNNLAELYRVKKVFDKAEPLYLEAISILQESFGPEDIRVGAACHNLGQFYLVQRKLEDARICYEVKGRVLGYGNIDYADTMYHLGMVLYLQGKENDSEALFQDSIRILEENGQGESMACIRRLRYLAQIYMKANRLAEAENVQRKILHIMEISKGWKSLDTVIAAEGLALTLQSTGSLREAQELFERCLDARKKILPQDHIQVGANMLHIARVAMLNSNRLRKKNVSEAIDELGQAKELLDNSRRIAWHVLNKSIKQKGERQKYGASRENLREGRTALVILLQSLEALALLETTKQELQESMDENLASYDAENALFECISAYKEFENEKSISDSPEVKTEYLSCLKHLSSLIGYGNIDRRKQSKKATLQELKDEIKRIEVEISSNRRYKR